MRKRLIFLLSAGVSLFTHAAPVTVEGTSWVVKKAEINTDSERTLHYQYNDDRLVGRAIHFNQKDIVSTLPEEINCQQPQYKESIAPIDDFIKSTMGEADSASAKSYELDINGKERVTVLTPICQKGNFGGADTGENSKIVLLKNKIFINWYDGIILMLIPLDPRVKPDPSFSCSKAKTPSEKTICSDYDLSSYDRSINNAWKEAKDSAVSLDDKELTEKLLSTQKEWLNKRNACGDDKVCLKNNMVVRLQEISSMISK